MSIQTELRKLMEDLDWNESMFQSTIKFLQNVSIEKTNALPYYLRDEAERHILKCLIADSDAKRVQIMSAGDWGYCPYENTHPEDIYRISPSFTIDLSETPPRYERGTPLVNILNSGIVEVVPRSLWRGSLMGASDDWFCIETDTHELEAINGDCDRFQQLPPRPELDGWEIVRAACIDGTQELADGETWVSNEGICASCPGGVATAQEKGEYFCNQWRWVARKVEQEPSEIHWLVIKTSGTVFNVCCVGNHWTNVQELQPKPELNDFWELTGAAVRVDGTEELADGEVWLTVKGDVGKGWASELFDKWRWVARRVIKDKVEPQEKVDIAPDVAREHALCAYLEGLSDDDKNALTSAPNSALASALKILEEHGYDRIDWPQINGIVDIITVDPQVVVCTPDPEPTEEKVEYVEGDRDSEQRFICYLIDHSEGETITEEFLQRAYGEYLLSAHVRMAKEAE